MATKMKRQSELVSVYENNYKKAIDDYAGYGLDNESPTMITYFKINSDASREDYELENTKALIGLSSPIKYDKIRDVPAAKLSFPEIQRQLTDRGLEAMITSEFILTPNIGIRPRSDEFFIIQSPEFERHLFKITEVQYDRPTSNKYFRCTFELYHDEASVITANIEKSYILERNEDGSAQLITESNMAKLTTVQKLIDSLIDEYTELFYNPDTDTFEYLSKLNNIHYFCPYLIHFMYKTKCMRKYETKFMQEIFIHDYREKDYPNIYYEESYRNSIYYAVEYDDYKILNFNSTFYSEPSINLNDLYLLPFYTTTDQYKLIEFYREDNKYPFYLSSSHLLLEDETFKLKNIDKIYKYVSLSDYDNSEKAEGLKAKRCLYQFTSTDSIAPIDVKYIMDNTGNLIDADLISLIEQTTLDSEDSVYLFKIIKDYFSKKFTPTDEIVKKLNIHFYKKNIQNYLLMPIVIYILKEAIGK